MFDIFSWQHIVILLGVALVVVGPKDLPRLMHKAGKWAAKGRNMAGELRRSFDEMARQTELDELRKEIGSLKRDNPVAGLMNSVSRADSEVSRQLDIAASDRMGGERQGETSPAPPSATQADLKAITPGSQQ
jgi:sec-independent protein translocase protein TatB